MKARMFLTLYMVAVIIGVSACLYINNIWTREELSFVYCEFCSSPINAILIGVENIGATSITIIDIHVNSISLAKIAGHSLSEVVVAGETERFGFFCNWSSGFNYDITLVTARGNTFLITEEACPAETLLEIENVSWSLNSTSIVIRNTGVRTRKIIGFSIRKQDSPNIYRPITAFFTNLGAGKLLPVNQTATIVLNWPNPFDSFWVSNQTYCFIIEPETGMYKEFNSTAPL